MTNAPWWLAPAVGLVSGLFAGFAGRLLEEWFYRPRLKVEFLPDEDGFRTEAKWKEKDGTEVEGVFIRARVINTRNRVAKQCRPYVVKLEEVLNARATKMPFFDSLV